jgi:hypothetical protein
MPKGEQRGNREAKKPKKEKPKTGRCCAVHEGDSRVKRRIQEVTVPGRTRPSGAFSGEPVCLRDSTRGPLVF